LLNTHLAYLANRGYVFVDYIPRDHPPFPDTLPNGTRHFLHIPMNAFTSGPTGGGAWGAGADASVPSPISERWWDVACPKEKVVEVQMADTMRELNITDATTGEERLLRWAQKLRDMPDECVSVLGGTPFDFAFINTDKVLSLWPLYGSSPTLTEFAWSALITRALSRNFALLSPDARPLPLPPALAPLLSRISTAPGAGSPAAPYPLAAFAPFRPAAPGTPIRGLLALHVRRGDYRAHCADLASWGSEYNTWNRLGVLPDSDALNVTGEARADAVKAHCWPTEDAIVARVRAVRASFTSSTAGADLRAVYIATNADAAWAASLADRLRAEGWAERVSSSHDMRLAADERAVAQAVDMGALVAAEVFIGNGFSSVTSNVVQLRLAGGRGAETSRFW
ncbi:hypothetical protein K438DRAFT_2064081, partial [Mycena galopus ATCC 62051]